MSPWFLFALLSLPVAEIAVLIKLFGMLGFVPTVALLLVSAAIGMHLLRLQGLTTWVRVRESMARGELPAREMLEGGLLGLGAILLIVPGIVTDLLALLCLLPPVRNRIADHLLRRHFTGAAGGPGSGDGPLTIQGEFSRDD